MPFLPNPKHHPDKAQQLEKKRGGVMKPLHSSDKLIRSLNKAYSTLYNERTRKVYDSLLEKQTCQSPSSSKRKLRVSHVLDLDSFQVVERVQQERKDQEEEEEEEGEQENLTFLHPCRCGQSFEITLEQISSGVELVGCQGCSEIVKVLWKEDQEEEEGKGKQEGSSSPLTELEDVFGRITSDSQVYASERLLVQDLLRTNSTEVSKDRLHLTSDHVHRYRINYLSPCLSGIVPDWMGVSHSFDDAVWWCFMGTDLVKRRWLEDDPERKAILLQWLQPFAQFLNGSDSSSSWGTDPSGRSIRVLDSDGSISIQQDKRWSQKADVLRAMDEARCIL
ncbi:hypothetical protein IE53DRAFT_108194 [Violaceomyces palustris]|uniref:Uncharacterized protein n=1 Tax=Violaceomyces palustris TaxID=1673888 RepID=A0ACD0P6S4_9BASI|nr:hypothetical protein IE53DRAFT_108194 [Violaceomyces palustris]